MRRHRRALIGLVIVFVGLLLADRAIQSVAVENVRRALETQLGEAFGLPVRVRGDVFVDLLPAPGFEARDLSVANLPGRPSENLVEVGSLHLDVRLWPLLFGEIEVDAIEIRDGRVHVETDEAGRIRPETHLEVLIEEEVPESPEPIDLRIRTLRVEAVDLFYLDGRTGTIRSLRIDELDLAGGERAGLALSLNGSLDGGRFDLNGRFGSLAELLAPTRPFPVWIEGRLLEARFGVEGSIEAPRSLEGLDLEVEATLPDLAALFVGAQAPAGLDGRVTAKGRLRSKAGGPLSLDALVVEATRGSSLAARLVGSVADVAGAGGVALELDAQATDLDFASDFFAGAPPAIGTATLRAAIADREGGLSVTGRLDVNAPDARSLLELEWEHMQLVDVHALDVAFEGRAADLASLGELFHLEPLPPPIGPVTVSGRLSGPIERPGVEDLRVRIGDRDGDWIDLDGRVGDALAFRNVDLDVALGATGLGHVQPYLEAALPEVGPIRGALELSDADGTLGIERLDLRGGRKGSFELALAGAFDDMREIDELTLSVELEARDASVLGDVLGVELPAVGPVGLAGTLLGANEDMKARAISLRLDETRFTGEASAAFTRGNPLRLRARLFSPHVQLADLGIEPAERDVAPRAPTNGGSGSTADPLPFELLRKLDLDIELRADRVTGRQDFQVENGLLVLSLANGDLRVRELSGLTGEGRFGGTLRIDASRSPPHLMLDVDGAGLRLGRLMAQVQRKTEHAGRLGLDAELRSHGRSLDELAAALDGRIRVELRDGTLASDFARSFSIGLLDAVIPGRKQRRIGNVSCLVAALKIEAGLGDLETFVLASDDIVLVGSGTVDIRQRELDLGIVPRVRDPSLLSMAATVDVKGPWADPTIRPRGRSLVRTAVRGLLGDVVRPDRALLRGLRTPSEAAREACGETFESAVETP